MKVETQLAGLLRNRIPLLLDQLKEAMIVMDSERQLIYANPAATELLGFVKGEKVSGRCRETTRGTDCSNSCPLSFMLEMSGEPVRNFPTVYRKQDGTPVSLQVTILPLKDDEGDFLGAIEILRPHRPDLGFYLSGESELVEHLREFLLSWAGGDLVLVGEEAACRDLALSLHRSRGLPDELFRDFKRDSGDAWPPRTLFGFGGECLGLLGDQVSPGVWRILALGRDSQDLIPEKHDVLRLPAPGEIPQDLPTIFLNWAERLQPGIRIQQGAIDRLVAIALESGLEEAAQVLEVALERNSSRLELEHFPCKESPKVSLWQEVADEEDPLAAVESRFLREVLEANDWKIQAAAESLRMSRVTLWRKMKQHHIERGTRRAPTCGE